MTSNNIPVKYGSCNEYLQMMKGKGKNGGNAADEREYHGDNPGVLDNYKYGGAGSIVWGLRYCLENIFWGSSKKLIWTIVGK